MCDLCATPLTVTHLLIECPKYQNDEFMSESENVATLDAVPAKSKQKYEKQFQLFDTWRKEKCFEGVTEEMMMEYLQSIGEVYKPSSLWTRLSMLKATLKAYENVDISSFPSLFAYLKEKIKHHKAKKAKALEEWHIKQFLTLAPDSTYLLMKVVLIIGISGGCRCEELTKLTLDNIEDKGSHLLVTLPTHIKNKPRKFIVINDTFGMDVLGIYYKYLSLRPANLTHNRLFLNYKKEKCTVQPVGVNTLSKIPREIATYLNLPDSDIYTGHSFRRSAGALLTHT
uniref:Uncharacterized protein LOC114343692 n=1 Tax=Diabrotica virgifera virgifera TaxID=50390 RepID=A0A6P7GK87_DIAVI